MININIEVRTSYLEKYKFLGLILNDDDDAHEELPGVGDPARASLDSGPDSGFPKGKRRIRKFSLHIEYLSWSEENSGQEESRILLVTISTLCPCCAIA